MEFTEDFIQKNGLTPEQITAINPEIDNHIAEEKKAWDGKANKDAEAIIQGAVDSTKTKFGLSGDEFNRPDGEKLADHLGRITPLVIDAALTKEKAKLQRKEAELNEKIKNGDGSQAIKDELERTNGELDKFKIQAAKFTEWEEADYKGKYEIASKDLNSLRLNGAYQSVKPSFPDTVNKFEATAKWKEFISNTNEKFNIELDNENTAWAVDKENEHKRVKLETLVEKDKVISELSKGREVKGIGGKGGSEIVIENVPFKITKNASPKEREKLIIDYLVVEEKLDRLSTKFSDRYKEINNAILKKN